MPCLRSFALAFNRFASSFKLEHSPLFSGVPASEIIAIVGAAGFSTLMAVVILQMLRSRAWFLWALASAAMLQCAGFIAGFIHSRDGTIHLAFLASFATITLAPLFLSVAIFITFSRLVQTVTPGYVRRGRSLSGRFAQRSTTVVLVPCLVPLALFAFGIYNIGKFLSPTSVGDRKAAFGRLHSYEQGIHQLGKAHAALALTCFIFGCFAGAFSFYSTWWSVDAANVTNKNWRRLLHTLSFTNGLVLVHAVFKMVESHAILTSKASLGGNGFTFWLLDVSPVLLALLCFCAVNPASYLPNSTSDIEYDVEGLYTHEKQGLMECDEDQRRSNPLILNDN